MNERMCRHPEPPECPNCGSNRVARILYGHPDFENEELMAAVERGEAALGGCMITNLSPKYECQECRSRWGVLEGFD